MSLKLIIQRAISFHFSIRSRGVVQGKRFPIGGAETELNNAEGVKNTMLYTNA